MLHFVDMLHNLLRLLVSMKGNQSWSFRVKVNRCSERDAAKFT